ncbi:MAG: ferredoxin, partial [Clostridiaceae bacterium]|nr:ferredoxin [Clostridiaceae bacterium]
TSASLGGKSPIGSSGESTTVDSLGGKSPGDLPQFTSCCPAWVKFAEQYYAEMLPNLSSCRSPQQMFGSLAKDVLVKDQGIPREDLVVISIMPCTAKKYEAQRPEFAVDGNPDVDIVLTTQETVLMIQESGLRFDQLEPESFDMPFGFKTGGGVIFGNSGGVSEAVLRYASEKLAGKKLDGFEFHQVRGTEGLREAEVTVGDTTLRLAVVSGLGNARKLVDSIRSGESHYDLVEVMACPGGCVNGGGQPITERKSAVAKRTKGLYDNDRMLPLHKAQENPYIREVYDRHLEKPGSHRAHELLHTVYQNRRRIDSEEVVILAAPEAELKVGICFGTSCFLRGAQDLYRDIVDWIGEQGLEGTIELSASFCSEECKKGPVVHVGGEQLLKCTRDMAIEAIQRCLARVGTAGN